MSVDPLDSDPLILSQQSAPIRVVVCGEFSAGKSSVINTIIRANVAKSFIGEDIQPIMIVRSGEEAGTEKLFRDHHGELVEECEVTVTQDHLIGYELIEIPMGRDGEISDAGKSHIQSADVFIWVTIGSQAWRLTEKQVLDQIGDILPKHRILTVSRADKLRSKDDRKKLLDRLEAETSEYFQHIVFVKGAPKSIEASANSYSSWNETSGKVLFNFFEDWKDDLLQEHADAQLLQQEAAAPVDPEIEEIKPSEPLPENVISLVPSEAAPVAEPTPVPQEEQPETPPTIELPPIPEPEPEPEPVDGLAAVKAIIEPHAEITNAGVTSLEEATSLLNLKGAEDQTATLSQWCKSLCANQIVAYRYDGLSSGIQTTQINLKNNFLIYRKLPDSKELVFLMASLHGASAGICLLRFEQMITAYEKTKATNA